MAGAKTSIDELPMSGFHYRVAAYTTGGMFCDGYILGIIGAALTQLSPQFDLNSTWQGLLGAAALAGIFLGSLVFGRVTDRVGRQTMYVADLALFVVGSGLQFFAAEAWQLLVLRLVMGIAIGADYAIGAALLAEFLPRRQRGRLLASLNAVWTVGYVVALATGNLMTGLGDEAWRWMLASSALPALLVLLMRFGTPESPRWLVSRGRVDEARAVVEEHLGADVDVDELVAVAESREHASWTRLFAPELRRRTAFAGLFWFCQVVPYFALFTFVPIIFEALGVGDSFGPEFVLELFLLAGAVVGVVVMDRLPRRGFLIWSFAALTVALGVLGVWPDAPGGVAVACFAAFAFVVSAAGNLETVYPSELFPTELRASGVGVAAATSRIGAAIGTFLLPLGLDHLGVSATILVAAAVLLMGLCLSVAWAPETRALTLREATRGIAAAPAAATVGEARFTRAVPDAASLTTTRGGGDAR
jgi:putative MFS transporter